MRTRQKPGQAKGATLIISIITCTLFLGFLMSALFKSASLGASGSAKAISDRQARYAAYAGIQRSFVELERNPNWRTGWSTPQPLVQNPSIGYTVDADDRPPGLGSNEVYLFSQGYPEVQSGAKGIAAYGGTAYRPGKIFTEAGFGYTSLLLSGSSTTNAYDSNVGYEDTEAQEEGSVGSTGTITVDNATVKGDAILAKAHINANTDSTAPPAAPSAKLILSGKGSITGDEVEPPEARVSVSFEKPYDDEPTDVITDMDALIDKNAPPDTPPTLSPGSYKSISVPPGKKLLLKDGEYYISDSLLVDEAELIIPDNAKVRIFIGGEMSAKNAKINEPNYDKDNNMTNKLRPEEFCLFFLDERRDPITKETIPSTFRSDNSLLNCAIAGKELRAELYNNTILYGAVSGDKVEVDNSTLHYDKSLKDSDMSSYTGWRLRGLSAEPPRALP